LTAQTQICKGPGSGQGYGSKVQFGTYQTLGDLWIKFQKDTKYTNYRRSLNVETAISTVQYKVKNVTFTREAFVSSPHNVLVIHIEADKQSKINFRCSMNRPKRYHVEEDQGTLVMNGQLFSGKAFSNKDDYDGMKYTVRLGVKKKGGKKDIQGEEIVVTGADSVEIYLSASTDYQPVPPFYRGKMDKSVKFRHFNHLMNSISYQTLKDAHIEDFSKLHSRVQFQLSQGKDFVDTIPTDKRIKKMKVTGKIDLYLMQLYFHFNRYLLISSMRDTSLPANLQGIWCNKLQPAWNCDYHTNINLQMNFWPVEAVNLGELHLSLTNFIEMLSNAGRKTAKVQYHAHGWVSHTITNVWGFTSPGEEPQWGLPLATGAWLCRHIWEHYLYSTNVTYLRNNYGIIKGAAEFLLDWLVINPSTGKLVSGPASSPENMFVTSNGDWASISMGPSHDQEIIKELFTIVLLSATKLRISSTDSFVSKVKHSLSQLQQVQIGKDGRIMEWALPFIEADKGHRHLSHLYGLYPGNPSYIFPNISYLNAAQKSLEIRLQYGSGQTGWSNAWVCNLWARLKNGPKALLAINDVLANKSASNLFDLHPPFQIDGNFGILACMAEMLLQSHQLNRIVLLPALPFEWHQGIVTGLKARGGYLINMEWIHHRLISVTIISKHKSNVIVVYESKAYNLTFVRPNSSITWGGF